MPPMVAALAGAAGLAAGFGASGAAGAATDAFAATAGAAAGAAGDAATGAAVGAAGAAVAEGTRIDGPPAGLGGRLMRTVCFFCDASAALGGSGAGDGGTGGLFSDIGKIFQTLGMTFWSVNVIVPRNRSTVIPRWLPRIRPTRPEEVDSRGGSVTAVFSARRLPEGSRLGKAWFAGLRHYDQRP
jgi:hypothetical protein